MAVSNSGFILYIDGYSIVFTTCDPNHIIKAARKPLTCIISPYNWCFLTCTVSVVLLTVTSWYVDNVVR